ncbi:TetR/AcrR family transcriptional regulator [Methanobacterium alcaliphilum]|uniref:TetR/AcrR family transcriptional regulator n=1 Tax=Methanobacterium alcaliphilum TaxID=392018 RepID=UPI00200B6651|nr:TetR/AcrR family transcriptional regulator [Methanobacterium alcaliphilum]MCK9150878.1 TetR/AcrR family transcriptional regulator [Methanobacterium alcaliphilum]
MVKRKSKEKRINEIINAAIDVFLEKGYENTTMETIAQKAGVSKGGLYHYFQSKDMILMMVNRKISENIEKMMMDAGECSTIKEGILNYVEQYISYWIQHPKETSFLFLSIAKIMDNKELLKFYKEFMTDYINYFEKVFNLGIQNGEFISHNTKTSAVTLAAAMDGVLSFLILDESLQLEDVLAHFEEKFIKPIEIVN